jgi:hypothetical protein
MSIFRMSYKKQKKHIDIVNNTQGRLGPRHPAGKAGREQRDRKWMSEGGKELVGDLQSVNQYLEERSGHSM